MKYMSMLWSGGKTRALTFSYDDGVLQDVRLTKLFLKYGMKATFNVNSGFLGMKDTIIRNKCEVDHSHVSASELTDVYKGFEVAVHTVSHLRLTELSDAEISDEVTGDRKTLEALVHYPVHGMAYPFGATDERVNEILKQCGIMYGRLASVSNDFSLPTNLLEWQCSCHHGNLGEMIDSFLVRDNERRLLSVWGHSYELDQKNGWEAFEDCINRLSGRDDIWYATNSEIFSYLHAWKSLDSTLDNNCVYNTMCIDIWGMVGNDIVKIPAGGTIYINNESDLAKREHPFKIVNGY